MMLSSLLQFAIAMLPGGQQWLQRIGQLSPAEQRHLEQLLRGLSGGALAAALVRFFGGGSTGMLLGALAGAGIGAWSASARPNPSVGTHDFFGVKFAQ